MKIVWLVLHVSEVIVIAKLWRENVCLVTCLDNI